jgi:hypothetical protein
LLNVINYFWMLVKVPRVQNHRAGGVSDYNTESLWIIVSKVCWKCHSPCTFEDLLQKTIVHAMLKSPYFSSGSRKSFNKEHVKYSKVLYFQYSLHKKGYTITHDNCHQGLKLCSDNIRFLVQLMSKSGDRFTKGRKS